MRKDMGKMMGRMTGGGGENDGRMRGGYGEY